MIEITKALCNFQKAVPAISKTTQAFNYKYADLATVLDTVRPMLDENGLGFYQTIINGVDGMTMRTFIVHESGESFQSDCPIILPEKFTKNPMQELGAAITYSRRYSLGASLGLVTEEDDDAQRLNVNQKTNNVKITTENFNKKDEPKFEDAKKLESPKIAIGNYVRKAGKKDKGKRLVDIKTTDHQNFLGWCNDMIGKNEQLSPVVLEDMNKTAEWIKLGIMG